MARIVEWSLYHQSELTDYIGSVGPFRIFTLSQLGTPDKPEQQWLLTVRYIPSKMNKRLFRDVEKSQLACQEIIDRFAKWISEEKS